MTDPATQLAGALMEAIAAVAPIFDAGDGIKADLEKRGWSPTAAEQVALQWVMNAMQKIWG